MTTVGTSGWQFDNWSGRFYDAGTPKESWLAAYAQTFSSVEVNNTFYQLPERSKLERWREATPPDFTFAIKANRYITHLKKLLDPVEPLATLYRHLEPLEDRIGPILFQLPPNWHRNAGRLEAFLDHLSAQHRHVFEFRDPTWFHPETIEALADHDAAFCTYDLGAKQSPVALTSDLAYVRLHGEETAYEGRYSEDALATWAGRVREWSREGRDVFVYFNNTSGDGHAPFDAQRLRHRLAERPDDAPPDAGRGGEDRPSPPEPQ